MHPHLTQKLLVLEPGIEPGTYCVLGSRHNQLDQPSIRLQSILGGTRTLNLEIRSLTTYPVRPRGQISGNRIIRIASMAEWSKALDLSSSIRENAWVRTPLEAPHFASHHRPHGLMDKAHPS